MQLLVLLLLNTMDRNCKCPECNLINARGCFEQRLRERKSLVSSGPDFADFTSVLVYYWLYFTLSISHVHHYSMWMLIHIRLDAYSPLHRHLWKTFLKLSKYHGLSTGNIKTVYDKNRKLINWKYKFLYLLYICVQSCQGRNQNLIVGGPRRL